MLVEEAVGREDDTVSLKRASDSDVDTYRGEVDRETERLWTYSKLLGAPPAVKDPADRSCGDKDDDRDNDCPACADHLVMLFSVWKKEATDARTRRVVERAQMTMINTSKWSRFSGGDVRLRCELDAIRKERVHGGV